MATSLFVSGSVKRWRFGRSTDARDRFTKRAKAKQFNELRVKVVQLPL